MKIDTTEKYKICLKKPLLLIKAKSGILACGYLNIRTFNDTEEACAIVSGVNDYSEMLSATISKGSDISHEARKMGVAPEMTGLQALEIMNSAPSPS